MSALFTLFCGLLNLASMTLAILMDKQSPLRIALFAFLGGASLVLAWWKRDVLGRWT